MANHDGFFEPDGSHPHPDHEGGEGGCNPVA